jgi:hypothetical protein
LEEKLLKMGQPQKTEKSDSHWICTLLGCQNTVKIHLPHSEGKIFSTRVLYVAKQNNNV